MVSSILFTCSKIKLMPDSWSGCFFLVQSVEQVFFSGGRRNGILLSFELGSQNHLHVCWCFGVFLGGGGGGRSPNRESSTVTSITLILCKVQNNVTLCKTVGEFSGYVVMGLRRTEKMFCGGSVTWICFTVGSWIEWLGHQSLYFPLLSLNALSG